MPEVLGSVLPEVVGGVLALVCAVVGAKLVIHADARQARGKELQEAYADVFAAYYSCLANMNDENILRLVSAMERTCLICSPAADALMRDTIKMLLTNADDMEELGANIQLLRNEAKKDVRNTKRK